MTGAWSPLARRRAVDPRLGGHRDELLFLTLDRLGELTGRDGIRDELEGSLRQLYESRIERLETHRDGSDITLEDWERARRALLAAERDALRSRERDGTIGLLCGSPDRARARPPGIGPARVAAIAPARVRSPPGRDIVVPMRATSEYERKLDAPVGFRLPPLGGEPLEPRVFTSVYYDVPGGSLSEAGITLRCRTEHDRSLWQLKLPAAGSRLELEEGGDPRRPPQSLLALLRAHLRHGPLERVAELRTRRRGELVARDGTTAEVTVDEVAVMDARRVRDKFVEVEVELRAGSPAQLDAIAEELARAGAEPGSGSPKVFRALGRDEEEASSSPSPFEELRSRLREQLREIERHDPGTRLGRDPESLHDMRVAVRRLRALLRAGRRLVASDTSELDARLKQLGRALGEVRDLDVLLARLEAEAAGLGDEDARPAASLFAALRTERSCSRARLLAALRSDEYLALLDDTARAIEELEPSGDETDLDALAARASARLGKAVRRLPGEPADEELHAVRKTGKRARYAAELAGRKKVVRRAKKLQDVLGEHQDAVVAAERLRQLAAEAAPEAALAAGRLVERERERRIEARAAWPKAWKKLHRTI